jgi:hypothetical protein
MLKIDIEPGDTIKIGDGVTLHLEQKSGQRARLSFDADRSIPIKKIPKVRIPDSKIISKLGMTEQGAAA